MTVGYEMSGNGTDRESTSSTPTPQEPIDIHLLAAESVICSDKNVTYVGPFGRVPGRLVVTRYRICFLVDEKSRRHEVWRIDIPLGHVSKIEKIGRQSTSSGDDNYGIQIYCKDLRTYRFSILVTKSGRKTICDAVNRYAFPISYDFQLFAFIFAAETGKVMVNGWEVYSHEKEFERLGMYTSKLWTVSEINVNYKFADTYPRLFVIPTASAQKGNAFLKQVGDFRSRKRIPVLSWVDRVSGASITRAAQPLGGMTNKKKDEDELHLSNIMNANGNCHTLLIFDARPLVNAKVNRARGGGYEENYENASLTFLDIHNIHVVRDSMKKFISAILPRSDELEFYKIVDESKWLLHLQSILEGSYKIVYNIENSKQSVMVHCSDGWDRTAQLTALAMLQLDKYYRTLEGFICLIEKEWCSFGHKFGQRIGHGDEKSGDSERAPIFVQFLDCVWQIMMQYPTAFEFTPDLLIIILDEMYACKFGTFLFNSEKIRLQENKCAEKTISLWTYVMEHRLKFYSPLYKCPPETSRAVLYVNPSISRLRIWTDYYARANPHVITPKHEVFDIFSTSPIPELQDIQQPMNAALCEKQNFLEEIQTLDEAMQKL